MATIVTRAGKGSPLTHVEVDANFTNLNTDKAELASPTFTGTPAAPTATVGTNTTQIATTAFVLANAAPLASPAFTGQASFADGSAAAPSIAHTGDLNAGLFFPAADTVAVTTAGSERIRIDASGNVGIGVSNPEDYRDFGPAPALVFGNTTGSSQATIVSGTASEGNLTFADGTTGNDSYRGMIRYNHSSDYMALFIAATERMRIDSSGNVSITQTPGKYTVDVTGGATAIANGGTVDFANASGMLVVNNHNSGAVSVYLCGGGGTTLIGTTVTQVGTFTYVSGIGGYRWTNNFGSTVNVGFFFVRTRTTA